MTWQSRGTCALTLTLLGLAGCMPGMLNRGPETSSRPPEEHVLVGSLETVATSTEDVLKQRDIRCVTTRHDYGVHIKAMTAKNGKFSIHLTREAGEPRQAERVRIRIEWEGGPKEPIHYFLFGYLEALPQH